MGLITSKGIVFRNLKYSENSVICDIFTQALGMRTFIISGSKSNRTKTNLIQVMNILDLVFYETSADKIHRIKECHLAYFYHNISTNMIKTSIGTFMMEVSRNTIKEQEENPQLFEFLIHWFTQLDNFESNLSFYHLKFMSELCEFSGFAMHDNHSEIRCSFDLDAGEYLPTSFHTSHMIDEESSLLLHKILSTNLSGLSRLSTPISQRNQLLDALIRYYQIHIAGFKPIKSLDILRKIIE